MPHLLRHWVYQDIGQRLHPLAYIDEVSTFTAKRSGKTWIIFVRVCGLPLEVSGLDFTCGHVAYRDGIRVGGGLIQESVCTYPLSVVNEARVILLDELRKNDK